MSSCFLAITVTSLTFICSIWLSYFFSSIRILSFKMSATMLVIHKRGHLSFGSTASHWRFFHRTAVFSFHRHSHDSIQRHHHMSNGRRRYWLYSCRLYWKFLCVVFYRLVVSFGPIMTAGFTLFFFAIFTYDFCLISCFFFRRIETIYQISTTEEVLMFLCINCKLKYKYLQ